MTNFTRAKWIEDGSSALEIQHDPDGRAKFVVHQRHQHGRSEPHWTAVHTSGLYADAGSVEHDGLKHWQTLLDARFGGMTVNERLFEADLIRDWDEAVRIRDRDRMILILSAVELENQAGQIVDAVLST